jgi:hypothetical protein
MRSKLPSLLRLSTRTRAYEIFSNSDGGDRDYFAGVVFSRSLKIMIKSRTNTVDVIQNVGRSRATPDPRRNSRRAPLERLGRAYRATAEFFDRTLAAPGERQ